jgi:lipid-binding SYLF domain-containing protein
MKAALRQLAFLAAMAMAIGPALADKYDSTVDAFKNAGQSASYFSDSYAYAVFPTIAKGGLGVGAAHGKGRVYRDGTQIGATSMTQVSFGFQAGGQAYSEIVFFKDKATFDRFRSGQLELGADIGAVAITASAGASAGTEGATASAGGSRNEAATAGGYHHGLAVFTLARGGLMYQAAVAGQKFSYKPVRVASK